MEEDRYLYAPLGLLFVTMGENHEQVSFAYPFHCDPPSSAPSGVSEAQQYPSFERQQVSSEDDRNDAEQYGVPTKILAHLLSARGICDKPFEIKIDNIRFAGFPKTVTHPTGRSPQTFHVVFILIANAAAHLVSSFQELSRKIAIAIDAEQTRCGYLNEQMTTILNEHDKSDADGYAHGDNKFPYREILAYSSLAQDLRDVFNDVSEYGVVHIFSNDCIEVGFCVEPRALMHAGLTPKTRTEVEESIRSIRPYHGILLLENAVPSPDSNPALQLFLKYCEPDQSLLGISNASGLPLFQTLLVVRHLLLWARAIVIFPLCSTNVYTSATTPKPLIRLSEQYSEKFENANLPTILAQFSPPCTLAEFTNASLYSVEEQRVRVRMVASLLRDELIEQLHTFFYLLPPLPNDPCDRIDVNTLEVEPLRNIILSSTLTDEIKSIIGGVCKQLLFNTTLDRVFITLTHFLRLTPFLNGEHHIEDIMYRLNLERSVVIRVLDIFSCVLSPFMRPEYI